MSSDEAIAFLMALSKSAKAFFIEVSPDLPVTHGGECRISGVTESWLTVTFNGKSFRFPLDVAGMCFEGVSPLSLPPDDRALIPQSALLGSGLLIIDPSGRSLFLLELP